MAKCRKTGESASEPVKFSVCEYDSGGPHYHTVSRRFKYLRRRTRE